MKKQIIIFILVCILLSFIGGFAQSGIKLIVNDTMIYCDVPPIIVNDRTLVPARALFEPLGATLSWNDDIKQAKINLNDNVIKLNINSITAYVNEYAYTLDTPPLIISDRTMLPIRFVAENLGYSVDWDSNARAVIIDKPVQTPAPTPPTNLNSITDIDTEINASDLTVKIDFFKPLDSYDLYPLDNPYRIVLELNDCTYKNTSIIEINQGGVQRIRMGNHENYFKIVVDLNSYLPYDFKLYNDKTSATLTFTLSDEIPKQIDSNTVVIDAGHGGSDPGALGYKDGEIIIKEKDINLDIALQTADFLKAHGVNVLLTRSTDVYMPLNGRYSFANSSNAGLFVSIHNNSFPSDTSISGTLTLYSSAKDKAYPDYKSSKEIAQIIQDKLVEGLETQDRGIRSEDELAVLKNTKIPAILIEVIFVTSPLDQEFILNSDNVTKAAKAIAEGILTVLGK